MNDFNNRLKDFVSQSHNCFDLYAHMYFYFNTLVGDIKEALRVTEISDITIRHSVANAVELITKEKYVLTQAAKDNLSSIFSNEEYNDVIAIAVHVFQEIDIITQSAGNHRKATFSRNQRIRPLNTPSTHALGLVYERRDSSLLKKLINDDEEFFRLQSDLGLSVDALQKHLHVVPKSTQDYTAELIHVPRVKERDGGKLATKNITSINVAMVPICNAPGTMDFPEKWIHGQKYFEAISHFMETDIDGNSHTEEQEKTALELYFRNIFTRVKDKAANIVVFPEMIMTANSIAVIRNIIHKEFRNDFLLVVCGSVWGDRSNVCTVLNGNGKVLGTQRKLNDYHDIPNGIEDIDVSSALRVINYYEFEGFGRFVTPICADFTNPAYKVAINDMKSEFAFIPALTGSLENFKNGANSSGEVCYMCVFLSNSCFLRKENPITMSYIGTKHEGIKDHNCDAKKSCDKRKEKASALKPQSQCDEIFYRSV